MSRAPASGCADTLGFQPQWRLEQGWSHTITSSDGRVACERLDRCPWDPDRRHDRRRRDRAASPPCPPSRTAGCAERTIVTPGRHAARGRDRDHRCCRGGDAVLRHVRAASVLRRGSFWLPPAASGCSARSMIASICRRSALPSPSRRRRDSGCRARPFERLPLPAPARLFHSETRLPPGPCRCCGWPRSRTSSTSWTASMGLPAGRRPPAVSASCSPPGRATPPILRWRWREPASVFCFTTGRRPGSSWAMREAGFSASSWRACRCGASPAPIRGGARGRRRADTLPGRPDRHAGQARSQVEEHLPGAPRAPLSAARRA